ncbi:helix-turn-helix domain-containing protein [Maridesulfovibrio frigidus]|uniref:helix-turn-helix domain-containing protein n=1 Tax=Maridesulfovibrio frigidus TaxID=340956 RepID=UPI0004E0B892|nr:helix-turn-helix domain-containing protein [Maridesulfovibrio frigidus]
MKTNKNFDFIWKNIKSAVKIEVEQSSLTATSKKLDIVKSMISRWLNDHQEGANLKTIVRIVDRLDLNWEDLVPVRTQEKNSFDSEVGIVLRNMAKSLYVSSSDIQKRSAIPIERIEGIFKGELITIEELSKLCSTLGCSPDTVINSAKKIVERQDLASVTSKKAV